MRKLAALEGRNLQHLSLLLLLLLFYCLPQFLVFYFSINDILNDPSHRIVNQNLLRLVGEVSSSPENYFLIIHQMIMPLIAAITAISFSDEIGAEMLGWVFVLPLLGLITSLLNALLFGVYSEFDSDSEGAVRGAVKFFGNSASTLGTYVMLLLGLQIANK